MNDPENVSKSEREYRQLAVLRQYRMAWKKLQNQPRHQKDARLRAQERIDIIKERVVKQIAQLEKDGVDVKSLSVPELYLKLQGFEQEEDDERGEYE